MDKKHEDIIKMFEKLRKEVSTSKKKAKEILDNSGIYTKSGNLKSRYK